MAKRITSHGIAGIKGSTGMEWEFGPSDAYEPCAHHAFSRASATIANEKIQRPERSKAFIIYPVRLLD
jgi:hypothetical protein